MQQNVLASAKELEGLHSRKTELRTQLNVLQEQQTKKVRLFIECEWEVRKFERKLVSK